MGEALLFFEMALLTVEKTRGRPWAPQQRLGALSRELAGKEWGSASREAGSPASSPLQPADPGSDEGLKTHTSKWAELACLGITLMNSNKV